MEIPLSVRQTDAVSVAVLIFKISDKMVTITSKLCNIKLFKLSIDRNDGARKIVLEIDVHTINFAL